MKQSSVIQGDGHHIEPYRFKVLSTFPKNEGEKYEFEHFDEANIEKEEQNLAKEEQSLENLALDESPNPADPIANDELSIDDALEEPVDIKPQQEPEPSFIEELLKRTDELSDNIIKLQMKIESQESEFKERLAAEVQRAREEGIEEGKKEAQNEFDAKLMEIEAKFANSISKIDEEKAKLEEFLHKNEEELSKAAVQIAKEVIIKEVSQNSSKVAFQIATNLIKELEEATKLEIKANSKDLAYLEENLNLSSKMSISSDDAIAPGGIVILSDIGNIDGNILTRFEKIKQILGD